MVYTPVPLPDCRDFSDAELIARAKKTLEQIASFS